MKPIVGSCCSSPPRSQAARQSSVPQAGPTVRIRTRDGGAALGDAGAPAPGGERAGLPASSSQKYFDDRGYLQCFVRWGANDGPDDAFENFNRWPELHALGRVGRDPRRCTRRGTRG